MARIYNPNPNQSSYQGSAQGGRFFAERAIDTSKQEKEKMNRDLRDIETLNRNDQRQFAVEQSFRQAENVAKSNQIKMLGEIGKLSVGAMKLHQQIEADAQAAEQENQWLQSIGFDDAEPSISEANFNQAAEIDTAIDVESTAIDQTAAEVEQSGELMDQSIGNNLRQSSAFRIASPIRGNIYAARANHGAYMQEAMLQISDDQKPRSVGEAQALIRDLNRQFFKDTGLLGTANRSLVAKHLAPTIVNNNTNLINQLVKEGIKADQQKNLNQVSSQIYNAVASPASAAEVWKIASEGMAHGNVGYTGRSGASNEAAVKQIIKQATTDGDDALLQQLLDTPKIPGQPNGPKLGDEYGHLIGPAITAARSARHSEIRAQRQEVEFEAKSAVQSYYDDPSGESKARLIERLQQMPQTEKVRTELDRLTSKGFNNDPELEADLAARAARGDYISQDELKSALDKGLIRPEVYKQHALSQVDLKTNAKAGEVTKELKPFIEQSLLGDVSMRDLPATTRTVFNMRVKMFQDELTQALAAEARSNPAILDNLQERNNLATQLMQQMAGRPEYTLTNDPKIGVKFQADPGTRSAEVQGLTIAPGEQDFRGISRDAVLKNVPRSEISASDDLLLSAESLNLDVNNILRGEKVSPNTRSWARSLGLSERAFIDAQLERNGKPSLSLLESQSPKAAEPGADLNAESGFQHLQSMGFPVRGAAYITSAISHESTWVGMREWGQVAGDGTNRNGGLISWASWHNNSARLGAIERHFGRNIASITETEQLAYMQHEMRTRYPKAYRISTIRMHPPLICGGLCLITGASILATPATAGWTPKT